MKQSKQIKRLEARIKDYEKMKEAHNDKDGYHGYHRPGSLKK